MLPKPRRPRIVRHDRSRPWIVFGVGLDLGRSVAGTSRRFAAAHDFDRSWGSSGPFADIAEPTGKQAQRLWLLRLHPIRRLEVFSGISDELRVGWMIDGFHASDDAHQLGIVVVNVLDQLGLRIGWS
jgi:hypothetical protein